MAWPDRGSSREVLPGLTLTRSLDNRFAVITGGRFIGWIHASAGTTWRAYVRPGVYLGHYGQDESVRRIARAEQQQRQKASA